jgi:hypothetical protein
VNKGDVILRNQGYDFPTDYVNGEENSGVQMHSSAIVGLPPSLSVNPSFENQQGKVLVPTDISGLTHLQGSSLPAFPSCIMLHDVSGTIHTKVASIAKNEKRVFQCPIPGCGKQFETQWSLSR